VRQLRIPLTDFAGTSQSGGCCSISAEPSKHNLHGAPGRSMSYDDLIELARLCLKQAASTSNATAAAELRRLAGEYQARAQALADEPHMPDIAAAFKSSPQGAQPSLQQQQPQPDGPAGGKDNGAPD
jgi:hypothetical protein